MADRLATIRTPWTDIIAAQAGTPEMRAKCLEELAMKYYEPVRVFMRHVAKSSQPTDIDDLTQAFFQKFLEKNWFDRLDQERGRFRGFLMSAARSFARDEHDKNKRYAAMTENYGESLSSDHFLQTATAEDEFNRTWTLGMLTDAIEIFQQECLDKGKRHYYEVFSRQTLSDGEPSYAETAAALGVSEKDVSNYLYQSRKRIRKIIRDLVRDSVMDENDVDEEMNDLRRYFI